ncbi:MAG: hemerythrin domain-containing protein [Desulfatiglandales bacterium]
MLPIGPLMIEHRRIERMIDVIGKALARIKVERQVDPAEIDVFVDFIRTYADRCHHGKEEDILFRELLKKDMSEKRTKTMEELIEEHRWGRKTTARLVEANKAYAEGGDDAISEITECLSSLVVFYPRHIEKEDRHFFIPVMDYFSPEEKNIMLEEGYAFDQKLIHEKYEKILKKAEAKA